MSCVSVGVPSFFVGFLFFPQRQCGRPKKKIDQKNQKNGTFRNSRKNIGVSEIFWLALSKEWGNESPSQPCMVSFTHSLRVGPPSFGEMFGCLKILGKIILVSENLEFFLGCFVPPSKPKTLILGCSIFQADDPGDSGFGGDSPWSWTCWMVMFYGC